MPKEDKARKAGSRLDLRALIDRLLRGGPAGRDPAADADVPPAPMSPRDFINKRMLELDKKKDQMQD